MNRQRHYSKGKLFNHSVSLLPSDDASLWASIPPYIIAKFGGELTRVMISAAEQFLFEKSLAYQQQSFEKAAFGGRNQKYSGLSNRPNGNHSHGD